MSSSNRRGQITLGTAATVILTFGAIFITLAVLLNVLSQQAVTFNEETVTRTNNESTLNVYEANTSKKFNLTNTRVDNSSSVILVNNSGASPSGIKATIPASAYTIVYLAGGQAEVNFTNAGFNGTVVGVNYTFVSGQNTVAVNTTRQARLGLNSVTDFGSTMGILIVVSILLALVFGGLVGVSRR